MSTAVVSAAKSHRFYKIALEYYVAGRGALRCHCTAITGNLLHHAVEMLLKGQLSKTIPLGDLKSKFIHKLPKLWTTFKCLFPAEDLTEFDTMIDELEKFEEIRYPDESGADGVAIGLGFCRGKPTGRLVCDGKMREYEIGVGDVDAFFARLFPLCRLNPKAYFTGISPLGRQLLTEFNDESDNWLDPQP